MSHVRLYYHIVFVTKHRNNAIPQQYERILFKYIHAVCLDRHATLIRINGTPCHIHLLVALPATLCVADFVRDIKRSTSMMLKRTPGFPHFTGWAKEYSCDTVSYHHLGVIKSYIINQKEHHASTDIETELSSLFNQDMSAHKFD